MKQIEATYRIVTPMFLGGADTGLLADAIRPPSIKGALRFWWRALRWSALRDAAPDDASALVELHKQEAALFGAAASANGGSQASFILRTERRVAKQGVKNVVHEQLSRLPGARYLGYGLMERPCVEPDQIFTVQLRSRQTLDATVYQALIAFGLLGGLGSRVRHGFGSVALESVHSNDGSVKAWEPPSSQEGYATELQNIFGTTRLQPGLPPFTTLSALSRIDLVIRAEGPLKVLDGFGQAQMRYRSWGRNGMVLGTRSEMRFKEDHDWLKGARAATFHPRRVVFGLPHNYGKKEGDKVAGSHYARRSSPLLFHVHRLNQNSFVGVSVLMPAQFLPDGEQIKAGYVKVPQKVDWNILTDFIDGKDTEGKVRFATRQTI